MTGNLLYSRINGCEWTGSSRTDIGTGQSTYELRTADAGSTIEVEVTFTDVAGNSEGPLTSAATDVVASNNAPPAPEKPRVYGSSMQSGSTTVLEVQWQVPRHWTDNPPSIDSYDVRYRVLDVRELEQRAAGRDRHAGNDHRPHRRHTL